MRVLQISSIKKFGGGEKHFADLAEGLQTRGHEVFACIRPVAEWKNRLSFLPKENLFDLPLRNALDIFSARKIAGFVRERNIDIIHAHAARDYPIAALAARAARVKLVLTRHLLHPLNSLHKFFLPKDASFIAVSEGVRQKLLRQKLLPPAQIHLIYNGIDTLHFQTAKERIKRENLLRELKLPVESLLVGIVGEIAPHKGQTDFVCAAFEISRQFPATEFIIVGQDNSEQKRHQKRLENLIARFGLQKKVHLLGWFADPAPIFAVTDVFVSASRVEPFGLVIAEAMSSACAVVAAETDGAKEIIEDNRTGKIVPIKNPAALAEVVSEFLQNKTARKTFGQKAQESAREKFDIKKMIDKTETLYEKISAAGKFKKFS